MLSRKAGYAPYAYQYRPKTRRRTAAERKFSIIILRTLSIVGLICFFLLTYIALSAAKTDYSYALMNQKRQIQQLQRENEALRVDIARLEAPERIYTTATKDMGMVVPAYVLYGDKTQTQAGSASARR